jgi:hypothetical protein
MLVKAGHEHNVDMDLLASVVKAERGQCARGAEPGPGDWMQLMPPPRLTAVSDSFKPNRTCAAVDLLTSC